MNRVFALIGSSLLFVVSSIVVSSASAATYTIDPSHSEVSFSVRHLGISKVSGKFDKYEGTIDFDAANVGASKTNVTIQASSINTNQEKRDTHLKACDFFCVEKFGTLTFASKSVKPLSADKFQVVGDLSLHGITKEVTLDVTFNGEAVGPDGNSRAGFSATGDLNRKDFGLTWSKLTEAGGVMVGDEVNLRLEIEATKNKA